MVRHVGGRKANYEPRSYQATLRKLRRVTGHACRRRGNRISSETRRRRGFPRRYQPATQAPACAARITLKTSPPVIFPIHSGEYPASSSRPVTTGSEEISIGPSVHPQPSRSGQKHTASTPATSIKCSSASMYLSRSRTNGNKTLMAPFKAGVAASLLKMGRMAERVGFEPTIRLPAYRISSAAHSTSLPPLRKKGVASRRDKSARRRPEAAQLA